MPDLPSSMTSRASALVEQRAQCALPPLRCILNHRLSAAVRLAKAAPGADQPRRPVALRGVAESRAPRCQTSRTETAAARPPADC